MAPEIGRSIGSGFRVASKSWPGIGMVAGVWCVASLIALGLVMLTKPPMAALTEEQAVMSRGGTEGSAPGASAATSISKPATGTAANATTDTPPTTSSPGTREEAARQRQIADWFGRAWPAFLVIIVMFVLVNAWLAAGQIGFVAAQLRTQRASLADFLASGAQAFGPLLAALVLSAVAVIGVVLLIALVVALFSGLSRAMPGWVPMVPGMLIGVAMMVGLIWLGISLSFWFVAIVLDRVGPLAGLRKSLGTVRGRWWQVAGLGLLLGVIGYAVGLVFALVGGVTALAGGVVAVVLRILVNVAGLVANTYVTFAALGALIQFYLDAHTPSASTEPVPSTLP